MMVEELREYVVGWVDLALFSNFLHLQGVLSPAYRQKRYSISPI